MGALQRKTILAVAGLVLLMASGCAPTPREMVLERDLQEMKRRLAAVERSESALRQEMTAGHSLDQVQASLAKQQAAVDAMRVDLQALYGRLDDLQRTDRETQSDLGLLKDEWNLKNTALENRLTQLEQAPPPPAPPAAAARTPEGLYHDALSLIQKDGDYQGGRQLLETFLKKYPDHELRVNAMYWIGEAYYGEKQYENAILQFQDVIQLHAGHPKVPAAMLKQGLAFQALGDNRNAKVILQKVIDSFPTSESAAKAKERLESMKAG